jgi:hypothetical protein
MEKFVMKHLSFFVACELGLVLSLAGCGGGGGGGGGGSASGGASTDAAQSGAAFTHRALAGDATARANPSTWSTSTQASSALANGTAAKASLVSGLSVTGGYTLKAETNGAVTLKNGSSATIATFNANNTNLYTKSGVDFAVMSSTKDVTGGKQTDYVWAGKLNYALFGYWAEVSSKSGTKALENGGTFFFKSGGGSLPEGYANAHYDGSNLGAFTGIAAGYAKYDDKTAANADTVLPLMGTASLTITNPTNGALVLDFSNFYKFTGNVNTSTSAVVGTAGGFSGTVTSLAKNGNAFPVDLPAVAQFTTNTINGQLFGTPRSQVSSCSTTIDSVCNSTPGEAAGVWTLKTSNASRDIEISGAFGVKK